MLQKIHISQAEVGGYVDYELGNLPFKVLHRNRKGKIGGSISYLISSL